VLLSRAPAVLCGYYGVVLTGYAACIAPLDRMNAAIRPAIRALVPIREPKTCWNGRWPHAARPNFAG
jgi:hypothetical protein